MGNPALTAAQKAVVEYQGGGLLVSAAAGSGKTMVLVERLLSRICDPNDPCNLDDFLIITFTRAAAAELRAKIAKEINKRLALDSSDRHLRGQLNRLYLAEINTVDSFCATILRRYAYRLDIPADFRIVEKTECIPLQEKAMELACNAVFSENASPAVKRFRGFFGNARNDRQIRSLIQKCYEITRCQPRPEKWVDAWRQEVEKGRSGSFSQTVWGQALLKDAHRRLDRLILQMDRAVALAKSDASLKKLAAFLADEREGYVLLNRCDDWDSMVQSSTISFDRFPTITKCPRPELKSEIKDLRDACKAEYIEHIVPFFVLSDASAAEELCTCSLALEGLLSLTALYEKEFTRLKRQKHYMDYSDLELLAVELLTDPATGEPTETAREISCLYREVMVDEYQDTNAVQDTIYQAVSDQGNKLFMVGDVKQSIYRFRLADPTIFLKKYHSEGDHPKKLLLSRNFRSEPEILEAANHVFQTVMSEECGDVCYSPDVALQTSKTAPSCEEPAVELHCINTANMTDGSGELLDRREVEAEFVASRILQLLQEEHYIREDDTLRRITPGDVTILMPKPSNTAALYQKVLQRHGIPVHCERGENIFLSTEICTLLAILAILQNPHQDIPLVTALASPIFCFSADDLAGIRQTDRNCDIYDALCIRGETDEKCGAFLKQLDELRELRRLLPLGEYVSHVVDSLQLFPVFGAMEDGKKRCENLQTMLQFAREYGEDPISELGGFLRYTDSLKETGIPVTAAKTNGDCVNICSIHVSKGLEYPVVFLCDLAGRFNFEDELKPVMFDTELFLACNVVDDSLLATYNSAARNALDISFRRKTISEQMRLLYVAMTRAKNRLIMTYCRKHAEKDALTAAKTAEFPLPPLLAEDVSCMGQWILYAAALRPEGGILFQDCRHKLPLSDCPWKIQYHDREDAFSHETWSGDAPRYLPRIDTTCTDHSYEHLGAARAPAKLTATQLKGRLLDAESAELAATAVRNPKPQVRSRLFAPGREALSPTQRGTALHRFLQYCRYEVCTEAESLAKELSRLEEQTFLSPKEAAAIDPNAILRFFTSSWGAMVLQSAKVHREFKFSLLTDAEGFYPDASGEKIMLQGVVDCFVEQDDGLIVLDYKTDRIAQGEEQNRAEAYRMQLDAYAFALERIFGLPVKEKVLYFFATGTAVTID